MTSHHTTVTAKMCLMFDAACSVSVEIHFDKYNYF